MTHTFIFWLLVVVVGGLALTQQLSLLWIPVQLVFMIVWKIITFVFGGIYGLIFNRESSPPEKEETYEEIRARVLAKEQAFRDEITSFSRYPLPFTVTRGVADRLADASVIVTIEK